MYSMESFVCNKLYIVYKYYHLTLLSISSFYHNTTGNADCPHLEDMGILQISILPDPLHCSIWLKYTV